MHISNWSARRSGASMTVKGVTPESNGKVVSFSGIKLIEQRERITVAVGDDGIEHILNAAH